MSAESFSSSSSTESEDSNQQESRDCVRRLLSRQLGDLPYERVCAFEMRSLVSTRELQPFQPESNRVLLGTCVVQALLQGA